MLDFSLLKSEFEQSIPDLGLFLFEELDSTNSYLKNSARQSLNKAFCLTRKQTAGYGQRQRQWYSKEGSWLFSLLIPIELPIHKCQGLSSVVGLSLLKSLRSKTADDLRIKWPNDLWNQSGKFAGVLIESVKVSNTRSWLVIGVGINFGEHTGFKSLPAGKNVLEGKEYTFSELEFISDTPECVLVHLVNDLLSTLRKFERTGFSGFYADYKKHDKFQIGEAVIVYDSDSPIKGFYRGLNASGECLIEVGGEMKTYISGAVSIRPNTL